MRVVAFLVTISLLLVAGYFAKQKQYKRALGFAAFWPLPLLIAFSLDRGIAIEQWLFWGAAAAFLYYAHKLLRENHIGYSFVAFLIATFIFFCGSTSVQSLLKTHLLWQVTSSLKSYGEKLDTFQSTVTEMRQGLEFQQQTNELNQTELSKVQATVRKGMEEFSSQQKKLEDVEYWVRNLYEKMTNEIISAKSPDRLAFLAQSTNMHSAIARLSHVPIPNSLRIKAKDSGSLFATEIAIRNPLFDNILFVDNLTDFDTNSMWFEVEYVIDARQTNIHKKLPPIDTISVKSKESYLWVRPSAPDVFPIKPRVIVLATQIQQSIETWRPTDSDETKNGNMEKYLSRYGMRVVRMRDDLVERGERCDGLGNAIEAFSYDYRSVSNILAELVKLGNDSLGTNQPNASRKQ